ATYRMCDWCAIQSVDLLTEDIVIRNGDIKLMVAPVKTGAPCEAGTTAALFKTRLSQLINSGGQYAMSGDGKCFLIIRTLDQSAQPEPRRSWSNWMAGLKGFLFPPARGRTC